VRRALPGRLACWRPLSRPLSRYLAVLLLCAAAAPLAPWLDAPLLDWQFGLNRRWAPQPAPRDVVLVGIDDAFLDAIDEPATLSHRYLAQFLAGVAEAGPAVIALDLALPEKRFDQLQSRRDPDFDFHRSLLGGLLAALRRAPLVTAKVWDHRRGHYSELQIDYAAVLGLQSGVQGAASALFEADADGRIRRYPDPSLQPDRTEATLSGEIATAMGARGPWRGLINYQLGAPFDYIPLQRVLQLLNDGRADEMRRLFHGRAVLLGTVLEDIDLVRLPVPLAAWRPGNRQVPGVVVQAQAVRSLLNGGLVAPAPPAWVWLGVALSSLFWFGAGGRRKLAALLLLSLGVLAGAALALRHGLWLAPAAPLLGGWIALLARTGWDGWRQFVERQRLSRTFGGYVSPQVMRSILDGEVDARRAGSMVEVCVLFSDVRGFTAMSEQLAPEQVVALLNRYFARMTAVVHRHGGTVDKFIGDGLMAFFGAPNRLPSAEQAAFDAAAEMLAEVTAMNRESRALGAPALAIGIGLHCGPAVIGYIGSAARHEYTAIGNTVNVAARIESLCKPLATPLLCSQQVRERLVRPAELRDYGPQPIKGHSAVRVHGWTPPTPSSS